MMYLLTMGWSLAHTSLAITPEHSTTKFIRLHLNRGTGHPRPGRAMLSKESEELCSQAKAAPILSKNNGFRRTMLLIIAE